ncbi:CoA-acylating methylmalonate-semialdehyde dehydrogenase [Nonomuraea sp. NPDC026600]|uniref:CoA-acylating methylmalonate-semialdehyde dehydrogenase n=1 Tax=Nonomuraea sp. NPDC026600 TaxID=3155363 RepID=UPI0033EEEA50
MTLITHWISGAPVDAGEQQSLYDPATGEPSGSVVMADDAIVDQAVLSAAKAFASWSQTSLAQRSAVMFRFRQLLEDYSDTLALCTVRQHGKTMDDARGEVRRGIEVVEYACGLGHLLKGEHSQNVSTGVDTYSVRQPLGVIAGITPFNFPVMVPLWMFPIALAAGNSFVLKPSDRDPGPSLILAELLQQAGLPEGVFNVVQGGKPAVDRILDHPDVAAVSFVGSTPVARHVYGRATGNGKRVQALGGAKNHAVVLPDADLALAADAITAAAFGSAGQRCMAISVVVAVGAVADPLLEALAARSRRIIVGDGENTTSQMGPLISGEHLQRVTELIGTGTPDGATLIMDGRTLSHDTGGHFLGPTIFDHVTPAMRVYTEEIFGPVLCVVRVDTFDEAIELINANPYGNGTAIFSTDGGACRTFQTRVTAGMVGINVPVPVPVAYHSFGGWKNSLFGDLHVYGRDGLQFCTRGQVVTSRWPTRSDGPNFSFPTTDR